MKDVYSFVANKDSTIVGCDSRILGNKDEAYEMATILLGIFSDASNIEIFKCINDKFVFLGSVREKEWVFYISQIETLASTLISTLKVEGF